MKSYKVILGLFCIVLFVCGALVNISYSDVENRGSIADQESFWVKIKKNEKLVRIADDEIVAESNIVETEKGKYKLDYDYDFVGIHENFLEKPSAENEMDKLKGFSDSLHDNKEFLTEMKSVDLRIMRIQNQEEFEQGKYKECVVSNKLVNSSVTANRDIFWARIDKVYKLVEISENETVAKANIVKTEEGIFKKDFDYHVISVSEDDNGKPGKEHEMIKLKKFNDIMRVNQEHILEMKNVDIHIAKLQTQEKIKKGTNRRCVVDRRTYSCGKDDSFAPNFQ